MKGDFHLTGPQIRARAIEIAKACRTKLGDQATPLDGAAHLELSVRICKQLGVSLPFLVDRLVAHYHSAETVEQSAIDTSGEKVN